MNDKTYFCIRGFMKSGTNWLGSLLSSHESVCCYGEFHWQPMVRQLNNAFRTLPIYQEDFVEKREPVRVAFENMVRTSLDAYAEPNAKMIGERTPCTIEPVLLRGAPHISIVRDGRDVLVSRVFHMFNWPGAHKFFDRFPEMRETLKAFQEDPWLFKNQPDLLLSNETLVRESARWWQEHVTTDEKAPEKYPALPIYFVRYEDLHRDVIGERKKLFEFLGVDPKRCAKIDGVLKPGFSEERPAEFLRKGQVGDWKNYFTDQTKVWFKEEAGAVLKSQGYVDSDDW